MERTGRVWVVGSLNVDTTIGVEGIVAPGQTILARSISRSPGGKGLNQAVAAARSSADVRMVGRIGQDDAAELLLTTMSGVDGLDTSHLRRSAAATGQAIIQRDAHGENSIVVVPGSNGELTAQIVGEALADIAPGDVVVCQLEIPLETVAAALRIARSNGALTVLNAAPAAEVQDLLADVDVLIVNETEAEALLRSTVSDPAAALAKRFSCAAVVTLGGDGSLVADPRGTFRIPASPVDVVDTTGAGDAFVGTLAAELSHGRPLGEAGRTASAAAAVACTVPGAFHSTIIATPLPSP